MPPITSIATPPIKAMILAAGRGERMRPLSNHTPKPLLAVHGKPMIVWHLEKLARAGVREVVINTAWLEAQFPQALGDGSRWGLHIHYCMEQRDCGSALGTAGGIVNALPYLGEVFWLVSGDIYAPDFAFPASVAQQFAHRDTLARLWVVPNPPYHPQGDFGIAADGFGLAGEAGPDGKLWTYASIALMRPALFAGLPAARETSFITPLLEGMRGHHIEVEPYLGRFENVGTPAQLEQLNAISSD